MISHGHVPQTRPRHVVLPGAYKWSGLVFLYPDLLTVSVLGQRAPDTHTPSYVAHIRAVAVYMSSKTVLDVQACFNT